MKKARELKYILKRRGARQMLPIPQHADNKATRGRTLVLAGSSDYPGAAVLCAQAALRAGSGYVHVAQKNIHHDVLKNPDFLVTDLNKTSVDKINFDALVCGPGFGVNDFTASIIKQLIEDRVSAVILDADALTVCAKYKIFPLPATWIVTPHTGELSRMLNVSSTDIDEHREEYLLKAQRKYGCIVLLKGHRTLIASKKRIYTISSGNSALAKAGTGDVLAGIITAFRAQGLSALRAALLGAYVHGATANVWKRDGKDLLSMRAVDLIESLPRVIRLLREKV